MITPEIYYLDEAAKKLGFDYTHIEPEWRNPLIRLGAEGRLPIYVNTLGLAVWEVFWRLELDNEKCYLVEKYEAEPFLERPKRLKLADWCLAHYAAGDTETVATTEEGRPYGSSDFAKSTLIIHNLKKGAITLFEPENNARLVDCTLIVLATDLDRFLTTTQAHRVTPPQLEKTERISIYQECDARYLRFVATGQLDVETATKQEIFQALDAFEPRFWRHINHANWWKNSVEKPKKTGGRKKTHL